MEIADVRRHVHETIERARHQAAARRARSDEASRRFDEFLEVHAVPLFRQIANVLKIEGYRFTVFTPSGSVRLASDRSGDEFIELLLDTSGDAPLVMAHVSRTRGRRVIDEQSVVRDGVLETLGEEDLLAFVLKQLEPLVER